MINISTRTTKYRHMRHRRKQDQYVQQTMYITKYGGVYITKYGGVYMTKYGGVHMTKYCGVRINKYDCMSSQPDFVKNSTRTITSP